MNGEAVTCTQCQITIRAVTWASRVSVTPVPRCDTLNIAMLGESVPYTDLLIRIGPQRVNAAGPSVEATVDSDSVFSGGVLNLDEQQLLAAEADNQAYGQILMQALFSEPIQRAYDTAMATAKQSTGGQVRVRLADRRRGRAASGLPLGTDDADVRRIPGSALDLHTDPVLALHPAARSLGRAALGNEDPHGVLHLESRQTAGRVRARARRGRSAQRSKRRWAACARATRKSMSSSFRAARRCRRTCSTN